MTTVSVTPEIDAVAKQYKLRLKALDAQVLDDLSRRYLNVYITAYRELRGVMQKITAARVAGKEVPVGWTYREERLNALMTQIHDQVQAFVDKTATDLGASQQQAMQLAAQYAQAMTHAELGPTPAGVPFGQIWANLDQAAIVNIAANTNEGPLANILAQIAPQAAMEARDVIVNGVAQGYNPRKVATLLHQQLGAPLARAQLIARTEILRAQREVTHDTFQKNDSVVGGWIWQAALDDRTCDFCWAMNGEHFDVEEELDTHPNCRCTMVPDVTSYQDAGYGAEAEAAYQDVPGDVEGLAPGIAADGGNIDLVSGRVDVYYLTDTATRDAIERNGFFDTSAALALRRPVADVGQAVVHMKVPLYKLTTVGDELRMYDVAGSRGYMTSGAAKFALLTPARQLKILGPAKYRAFKANAVTLRDFIGYKDNPVWGRTGYSKSLKEVLGKTEARKFYGMSPSERAVKQHEHKVQLAEMRLRKAAARAKAKAEIQAKVEAQRLREIPPKPKPMQVLSQVEAAMSESPLSITADMTSHDHVNVVFKAHLEGDGDAVVKPNPADTVAAKRSRHMSVPPGADAERELAGYEVAQRMGIDMPAVVTRDVLTNNIGVSSIQQWRDFRPFHIFVDGTAEDKRKIGLFDAVIGNLDRHQGQIGVLPDGKLLAYDHGLAFPSYIHSDTYDWMNDVLARPYYGTPLTPEETVMLERLSTDQSLRIDLEASGLDQAAIDSMYHRITAMLSTEKFLSVSEADQWDRTPGEILLSEEAARGNWFDVTGGT